MAQTVKSHSSETMPVAWHQSKDLGTCMVELYENSLWTDVKFHCKDHDEHTRIHAHKVVLAARSPVFQAMIFGPCADGKDEVELENVEAKILDMLLRYMYSDAVNLDEETASSVLEMAHYYQVTNLVQFCANYLATILTTNNACGILTLAMFYQLSSLRDACCSFIDKHADEVLNSEGFLELSEECLRYILKGDTFCAEEKEVFIKAEEWAAIKLTQDKLEKNGPNVKKVLGETFYQLRLPSMTFQTLTECTRRKGYLSADEYEDIIDFINRIPGSSVKSNSCVARLPTHETLIINREAGDRLVTLPTDSISTTFQISVTKDVTLSNIVLAEIQKCLMYDKQYMYYTLAVNHGDGNVIAYETELNSLFSQYLHQVVRFQRTFPYRIQQLTTVTGEDLSPDIDIVISGSLEIKWQKTELQEKSVEYEKGHHINEEEEANDTVDKDQEEDEPPKEESEEQEKDREKMEENTIFRQDFQLLSSQILQRTIKLRKPLTMTKASSPYTVKVHMNYSCDSHVKMRAFRSDNNTVKSPYGHIQMDNIYGSFVGVQSLGFKNSSNRNDN